jgi:hypothetical protein
MWLLRGLVRMFRKRKPSNAPTLNGDGCRGSNLSAFRKSFAKIVSEWTKDRRSGNVIIRIDIDSGAVRHASDPPKQLTFG